MSSADAVLLVNAAATWFMAGVIWYVQVVHYPMFACWGRPEFRATEATHQRLTSWVVGPAMLLEATTAFALPWFLPGWEPWVGAGLVCVWAGSTAFVQVPLHGRLAAGGYCPALHRRLVASNWVRTAAWSARGVLVGVLLVQRT